MTSPRPSPAGRRGRFTELRSPPAGSTDRIGCDLIALTALDCMLDQRTNHLTDRLAPRLGDLFEFTSGRATDSDSERRHYNHQSRIRDSARIMHRDCTQPLAELPTSFDERCGQQHHSHRFDAIDAHRRAPWHRGQSPSPAPRKTTGGHSPRRLISRLYPPEVPVQLPLGNYRQ